jgi:plastocyanin
MQRSVVAACGVLCLILTFAACGGSSNNYNPNTPTPNPPPPSSPPPASTSQIDIVGDRGNQSFTPNPATVVQGQGMTFKNNDVTAHRIVANDGSFDTGNIPGGGTSGAVTLQTNGTNYHCTIHPGMIGSINASGGAPPPCTGQYC